MSFSVINVSYCFHVGMDKLCEDAQRHSEYLHQTSCHFIVLALDFKSSSSELNVKISSINITGITNKVLPP